MENQKKELKLLILIPMESTVLYDSFMSFVNLFNYLKDQKIKFDLFTISGSAHAFARNTLLQRALDSIKKEKDYTHVLWMDSDHTFVPEQVIDLISQKEHFKSDIMGAGYLTKHNPIGLVALKAVKYRADNPEIPKKFILIQKFELNKVYAVDAIGFGMVVMHPDVLLAMEKSFGNHLFEFPLVEDVVLGEDVSFCIKAKMLGYKIDVTTGVMLGHITSTVMNVENAMKLYGVNVLDTKIDNVIDGWMTDDEKILLHDLAKNSLPGVIVEIGSWKGLSTMALGRGSKEGTNNPIFAVDPHTGSPEHKQMFKDDINTYEDFMKNITHAGLKDLITPFVMTSEEASGYVIGNISLLFIDGDHSYNMVKKDFELWKDKILPDGIIAFHDSEFEGPKQLISEISEDEFEKIGVVDSITYFKRK